MDDCRELAIAIEMRARGALEAPGEERLNAHLAVCEECRRYQALVDATAQQLQATGDALAARIDWVRIRRRVRWLAGAPLFMAPLAVVAAGAGLLIVAWRSPRTMLLGLVLAATQAALLALVGWWRLRGAARAGDEGEELLAFYRRQLDRELREHRAVRTTAPLLAAGLLVPYLLNRSGWPPHLPWILAAVAASLIATAVWAHVLKLPRLRRERAELDR